MKNFSTHIKEVVNKKVQKELGLKNAMAVPRLNKIVVSVGIGTRLKVTKDFNDIVENIAAITGQKPVVTQSKKAISNFKLRVNAPSGVVATLRKHRMLDFFNRMVNIAFPRIRDFQGFDERSFDGKGNYSIGIEDCSIFPEINIEDLSKIHGMNITVVTTAKDNEKAKLLLQALHFPFKKKK